MPVSPCLCPHCLVLPAHWPAGTPFRFDLWPRADLAHEAVVDSRLATDGQVREAATAKGRAALLYEAAVTAAINLRREEHEAWWDEYGGRGEGHFPRH